MKLKLISIVLLAGLMGYGGYWYFLSLNAGVFLEQSSDKMAKQGVVLTYSSYEVSGFPYRLLLTFENPGITFQNATNINSTLIFCRASADEFNYSSNPTDTDSD